MSERQHANTDLTRARGCSCSHSNVRLREFLPTIWRAGPGRSPTLTPPIRTSADAAKRTFGVIGLTAEYSLTNASAPTDSKLTRWTSNVWVELFVVRGRMSRLHRQLPAGRDQYHGKRDGVSI